MGLLLERWFLTESSQNGTMYLLLTVVLAWYLTSCLTSWYRLRAFRGPFLASLSCIWLIDVFRRGKTSTLPRDVQEKYGKIVRIGPNQLMVYDPETLWHINSARSTYTRSAWYNTVRLDPQGHSVLSTIDTAVHDGRKAKLTWGFSGKDGMNLERNVDTCLASLVGHLRKNYVSGENESKTVDIGLLLHYFQCDLISLSGVGKAWGDLETETDHYHFLASTASLVTFLNCVAVFPPLAMIVNSRWFLRLFGPSPSDKHGIGQFLGHLKETVRRRFAGEAKENQEHVDMLDVWIKRGLNPTECELDLGVQMPAGTETTLTTMRGSLLNLMCTPRVYNKLRSEINNGIRDGYISRPITSDEAKKLPYLQAVISENIRMLPPINIGFPKVVPRGGDMLHGHFVPEGTEIWCNFWGLTRNKEVFGEDADVFRPERFIGCSDRKRQQMLKVLDLCFGHGKWLCLGKGFTHTELNKVIVELLRNFDFQIVNATKPWGMFTHLTTKVYDFRVRVTESRAV